MNKTVIIIGSVALLGAGAYFYFKTKAKDETDSIGAGNGKSTSNVDKETKALKDIATKITESETKPKDTSIDVIPKVTYENIEKALVSLGIDQTRTVEELTSSNYKEARKLADDIKNYNSDSYKKAYDNYWQVTRFYKPQANSPVKVFIEPKKAIADATKKINALGYKVLHDYDIEKI